MRVETSRSRFLLGPLRTLPGGFRLKRSRTGLRLPLTAVAR